MGSKFEFKVTLHYCHISVIGYQNYTYQFNKIIMMMIVKIMVL